MVNICVVGAGAVGLSTAVNIQRALPNAKVTVIADKFGMETTSDGAAGIFRPSQLLMDATGMTEEQVNRYVTTGFNQHSNLALSAESSTSGNYVAHGYIFTNQVCNPSSKDAIFSFTELTPEQVKKLNVPYKYGYLLATCLIECRLYLPWLTNKFKSRGGIVRKRKIGNLSELVGEYDIVANCTGLGSRHLLNDQKVFAVRGQVLRMNAPWLKHFVYTDDGAYMFPVSDTIVFGGTRQRDNYSTEVDPADTQGILRRLGKLWPSVEGATIKRVWAGLRPHRMPLRIEKEVLHFPNGSLKVVHNYGHGPAGVMLSWGTSLDAADLVKEFALEAQPKSML